MSEDDLKQGDETKELANFTEPEVEVLPPVLRPIPQTRHHVKDEQLGLQIRDMAGMGLSKSQAALAARISTHLLDKYYLDEFLEGQGTMQRSLAAKAVAEAMDGNTPILLHLLKTKLGWSEQHQIEVSGEIKSVVSAKPLTKEEFIQRYLTTDDAPPE